LQAAHDELTATVERLEAQVTICRLIGTAMVSKPRTASTSIWQARLMPLTSCSSTLNLNVDELKATGEKAAEDVRMEGVLRRERGHHPEAAVKDLAAQVAGLRTELAS
jgi:hypothetical protein